MGNFTTERQMEKKQWMIVIKRRRSDQTPALKPRMTDWSILLHDS